jgi:hypothetical protein
MGERGLLVAHAQTWGYALVLNPIVFSETHTCRFSHVLIDGGSNINLLTAPQWIRWGSLQLS